MQPRGPALGLPGQLVGRRHRQRPVVDVAEERRRLRGPEPQLLLSHHHGRHLGAGQVERRCAPRPDQYPQVRRPGHQQSLEQVTDMRVLHEVQVVDDEHERRLVPGDRVDERLQVAGRRMAGRDHRERRTQLGEDGGRGVVRRVGAVPRDVGRGPLRPLGQEGGLAGPCGRDDHPEARLLDAVEGGEEPGPLHAVDVGDAEPGGRAQSSVTLARGARGRMRPLVLAPHAVHPLTDGAGPRRHLLRASPMRVTRAVGFRQNPGAG